LLYFSVVVLLGRLVTFSFLENKAKEGPNNRLEKVNIMAVFASKDDLNCSESKTYHICMQISQEILDITVEKSDFLACMKTKDAPSNSEEPDRFVLKRSAFCCYCAKRFFLFGIKVARPGFHQPYLLSLTTKYKDASDETGN